MILHHLLSTLLSFSCRCSHLHSWAAVDTICTATVKQIILCGLKSYINSTFPISSLVSVDSQKGE